jgi:hypothetical protein
MNMSSTPSEPASATPQPPESILSIRDPKLDVDTIMAEIRASLMKRRAEAEARGVNFDDMAMGRYIVPGNDRFPMELHEALQQVSLLRDSTQVSLFVTPSGIPIIGGLVQRIRTALHQAVIFYVNMSAERQIAYNVEVSRALNRLTAAMNKQLTEKDAQIADLQKRVEALEQQAKAR